MKYFLLIAITLFYFGRISSQKNVTFHEKGISFKVSNVEPTNKTIPELSYQDALKHRLDTKLESFPYQNDKNTLIPTDAHGFIAALHISFSHHRPFIISPDMIWLMICQGTAIHIEQNADSLRHLIVNFEGKKNIKIRRDDFIKGKIDNHWSDVFPQFSDSVQAYLKDTLYGLFVPKFSTTGINEKAAFEITFLSSVKKYFEFTTYTYCGIPEITLEGKTEDWAWIRNNIDKIRKFGLNNWVDNLIPILDEFVNASQGKIDKKFWQSIYKWAEESGGPFITGWIIKFLPYLTNSSGRIYKNKFIDGNKFFFHGITADVLPSGLSKVNFNWLIGPPGLEVTYPMEMYAGFLGIKQDPQSKALRPEISWAVIDSIKHQFGEKYDTTYVGEKINDSTTIETMSLTTVNTSPKVFRRNSEHNGHARFELRPFDTKWAFHYFKESDRFKKPIFFPEKYFSSDESYEYLKKYIRKTVGIRRYVANIEFIVSWIGTIENVQVNSTKYPKLNFQVADIIKNIPCKPGKYQGSTSSFKIYMNEKRF